MRCLRKQIGALALGQTVQNFLPEDNWQTTWLGRNYLPRKKNARTTTEMFDETQMWKNTTSYHRSIDVSPKKYDYMCSRGVRTCARSIRRSGVETVCFYADKPPCYRKEE